MSDPLFSRRRPLWPRLAMSAAGIILPSAAVSAGPARKGGRIRVASTSTSTADALDPAKVAINTTMSGTSCCIAA